MTDYRNKIAELQVDVKQIWELQCRNLYNSENLALLAIRECLQNSLDAVKQAVKEGKISEPEAAVMITLDNRNNTITVYDTGIGMNVETLHNKFLSLGGTTKGDADNVGGFGLAKAVILGCGKGFSIKTQDNFLDSDDLGKNPISKSDWLQGTEITIRDPQVGKDLTMKDDYHRFKRAVLDMVYSSELPYPVYVNGSRYAERFVRSRKSYRSPATFNISSTMIPEKTKLRIDCYKNPEYSTHYLYVRLRGLTQFKQYICWNSNCDIVVDFKTSISPRSTEYPFSTNRESLKDAYKGILRAIVDKVSQSPLSISSDDEFKETYFENSRRSIDKERAICNCVMAKDIQDTVKEVVKITSEGMKAQNTYKTPSLADRVLQYNTEIKDLAEMSGTTAEKYVKNLDNKRAKALNDKNPLEYSWLIWQDKGYKGKRINQKDSVSVILLWDSICRIMASNYSSLEGKTFYPGIIVKDDTLGMCANRYIDYWNENRTYIMVNPFNIKTDDPMTMALHLMGVAAHELAHFACDTYEAHGETFSYTREAIMNNSLKDVTKVVNLIKASKIKSKLSRLSQVSSKQSSTEYSTMSLDDLKELAKEYGLDIISYEEKYSDERILRMRLIMNIKKARG